jgi:hypothetical protein
MAQKNWWWPPVDTLEEAKEAARQGVWAAGFVAVITGAVAVYAALTNSEVMGIDAWAFVDAVVFAGIGVGIYRMWRVAAVGGLLLYVAERAYMMMQTQSARGVILGVILTLAFINAVRGTMAHHRLSTAEPAAPLPPTPTPLG